jgi:hypothetical protein
VRSWWISIAQFGCVVLVFCVAKSLSLTRKIERE